MAEIKSMWVKQAGPWRSIFQSASKLLESLIRRMGLLSMLFKMTTRLGECQDHLHRLTRKYKCMYQNILWVYILSLYFLVIPNTWSFFFFVDIIAQGVAVAFQTYQKNKYIACTSTCCTLACTWTTVTGWYTLLLTFRSTEWMGKKVLRWEFYWKRRVQEAIKIQSSANTMNIDSGLTLSKLRMALITGTSSVTGHMFIQYFSPLRF